MSTHTIITIHTATRPILFQPICYYSYQYVTSCYDDDSFLLPSKCNYFNQHQHNRSQYVAITTSINIELHSTQHETIITTNNFPLKAIYDYLTVSILLL
jgi:hypothetical protein